MEGYQRLWQEIVRVFFGHFGMFQQQGVFWLLYLKVPCLVVEKSYEEVEVVME
jgi:hypothetical protein